MNTEYVTNWGEFKAEATPQFSLIDNFIYLYHTDTLIILPTFPESITDSMNTSYSPTDIIGRSAPIYSYNGSGPRSIDFRLMLHRDMMHQINLEENSYNPGLNIFEETDNTKILEKLKRKDYVDILIKELQSIAVPNYVHGQKMVDPPLVAVRFGDEVFCKGIVDGGVTVSYEGPIIANPLYDHDGFYLLDNNGARISGKGKYAIANVSFKVTEVDPYDARTVAQLGSFRGLNKTLDRNMYIAGK